VTLAVVAFWLVALLLAGLAVFQTALALGAPLGHFAWGGGQRVLSPRMRVASGVAILLYVVFALIFADRTGLVSLLYPAVATVGAWAIAVYAWIGVLMNAISRSLPERLTMTPVSLLLAAAATLIALS